MLAVFPIHILETITICLILLNIYRIFRHLSLDNENNSLPIPIPRLNENQPALTIPTQKTSGTLTPEVKSSFIEEKASPKITDPNISTLSDLSQKQILHLPEKAERHQTVLKNYIGDFF